MFNPEVKMNQAVSVVFIFIFAFCVFGQQPTGSVVITVIDRLGAVIPNASITIESAKTDKDPTSSFRRTAITNEAGFQRISEIPPGFYKISVEAKDFDKEFLDQVEITSSKEITIELTSKVPPAGTIDISSTVPNGKVVVFIYAAANNISNSQIKPSIFIDGEEIAQISPERYMLAVVDPGKHAIHFDKSKSSSGINTEFKPGQIYFLRLSWKNKPKLKPENLYLVSKEEANISQLKMIDEKDVKNKQMVITYVEG